MIKQLSGVAVVALLAVGCSDAYSTPVGPASALEGVTEWNLPGQDGAPATSNGRKGGEGLPPGAHWEEEAMRYEMTGETSLRVFYKLVGLGNAPSQMTLTVGTDVEFEVTSVCVQTPSVSTVGPLSEDVLVKIRRTGQGWVWDGGDPFASSASAVMAQTSSAAAHSTTNSHSIFVRGASSTQQPRAGKIEGYIDVAAAGGSAGGPPCLPNETTTETTVVIAGGVTYTPQELADSGLLFACSNTNDTVCDSNGRVRTYTLTGTTTTTTTTYTAEEEVTATLEGGDVFLVGIPDSELPLRARPFSLLTGASSN